MVKTNEEKEIIQNPETNKLSNSNIIRNTSYNQKEILKNIMTLYKHSQIVKQK